MVTMSRRHQSSNIHDIFITIANGNSEGLQNYLQNGGNKNLKDGSGITLLHKATEDGDIKKVNLLMGHGCSVDVLDNDGCTPVYVAVNKGHHSILHVFLAAGALVNNVAFQHTTPLILSVIRSDSVALKLLLNHGQSCEIDMENYFRQSALTQAIIFNNLDLCEMLLSYGASVKCIYNKSFSVELARIMCQNIAMMKIFLKYSKQMDLNYHLMMACIYKKMDIAELILMEFENPFQLKALGFVTKQEEVDVWERLTKIVVQPYKLATKCSTDNRFLMMMLNFCKSSERDAIQKQTHKLRAIMSIRTLVKYGLVIHPQTKVKLCDYDCECRKCIYTAMYNSDSVTRLKGQCCSVIRQALKGKNNFEHVDVAKLPIPKSLQNFICMTEW